MKTVPAERPTQGSAATTSTTQAEPERDDSELLIELQRRLKKPRSTDPPKHEHLAVAVALARAKLAWKPLVLAAACKAAGVPAGGARTRIGEYSDRIFAEGLLDAVC